MSATMFLLAILLAVCMYLLLNSYFHVRRKRRQANYVHSHFPHWQEAIFQRKPLHNLPTSSKEYRWTIQSFLEITHTIQDAAVSRRIQELADAVFTNYLENELKSRSWTRKQYALAVIHELGMTALTEEIKKVQPASQFQASLKHLAMEGAASLPAMPKQPKQPKQLPSARSSHGSPHHFSPTLKMPTAAPTTGTKQEGLSK
ncbi:hypothetical protein [Corynebacterium kozikiae]|uniref:hypothetical protein n=1 Tax=Corynebacterium kozikiae TaxID=2968469 RepID=UPI00211C7D07|nr:hypothetical protein [Corynebacterium sp. 76QC2CO]MCQ9344117.1 hypothetical protein [Corynebacterium sp. 76QC2CO]